MSPDQIASVHNDLNRAPRRAAHRVIDPSRFVTQDDATIQTALSAMLAEPNQIKWRDVLIEQHMSMAWRVASSMRRKLSAASKLGQGPDDLYGSAMLGLVQGVEWVRAGRLVDAGVTGYLYVTIKRFVMDYC